MLLESPFGFESFVAEKEALAHGLTYRYALAFFQFLMI